MKDEYTELIEWFKELAPCIAVNVRRCALCEPDYFTHTGRMDEYAVESLSCHYAVRHRLLLERNESEIYKKFRHLGDLLRYQRIAVEHQVNENFHLNY